MSAELGKYVACDISKCSGCRACELACFTEHNKELNRVGNTVGTVEVPVSPRLYVTHLTPEICAPIQCKHCEDAPCLNICSKNAISKIDAQVIIDADKCIGCKDCMLACPFGAITLTDVFKDGKLVKQSNGENYAKVATKCDLCKDSSGGPACVRACPNKALSVVDPIECKNDKNVKALEAMYASTLK